MAEMCSVIRGVGAYLPEKVVTNDDLAKFVDTSDEWIVQRTGIRQRHFCADDEKTSDLATKAAQNALNDAGIDANDVDAIVLATCTGDNYFPATAVRVQCNLGIKNCFAYDVAAVCAGFTFALQNADMLIATGQAKTVLVIGAERMQSLLDFDDRSVCVLFGDGAGAVVVTAKNESDGERGIIGSALYTDSESYDSLVHTGGVGANNINGGQVCMDGREVFRNAVHNMSSAISHVVSANGYSLDDVDWVVPHQANKRIIDAVGEKLGADPAKVISTVDEHANISAATIPVALCRSIEAGQVKKGDLLAFTALGGGFAWGANLLRF